MITVPLIVGSIAIICIVFLYSKYAVGSLREYIYYHHTVRGRLERRREHQRSRAQKAVNKLVTMDPDDPTYIQWEALRDRALSEMNALDNAIERYDVEQEEERMLKGE